MYLTVLGFLMIAVITVLVMTNKVNLIAAFAIIPLIFALIGGFSIKDISGFVNTGVTSTFSAVVLILFAVGFFSLLSETCMFEILVNKLLKVSGSNVFVVFICTVVIAAVAHLDGSYNTTYVITIPALLPLYQKMNINKKYLVMLTVLAACSMTALPWSSVAIMVASIAGCDPLDLFRGMLPLFIAGLLTALGTAILLGFKVAKENAGKPQLAVQDIAGELDFSNNPMARPKLFWINFILFIGSIVTLMFVKLPIYYIFMLFFVLTLLINYRDPAVQKKLINKYCPTMLNPCLIFLAIGVMIGVMKESGMAAGMINFLLGLIPGSVARYTHIIIGLLSVPILVFIPYQLFYTIFPILIGIGANFGFSSIAVLLPFVMLHGSQCSPMTAAANLRAELAGFEITQDCKNLFFPLWIACTITIVVGCVSGALFS